MTAADSCFTALAANRSLCLAKASLERAAMASRALSLDCPASASPPAPATAPAAAPAVVAATAAEEEERREEIDPPDCVREEREEAVDTRGEVLAPPDPGPAEADRRPGLFEVVAAAGARRRPPGGRAEAEAEAVATRAMALMVGLRDAVGLMPAPAPAPAAVPAAAPAAPASAEGEEEAPGDKLRALRSPRGMGMPDTRRA